MTEGNGNLSGWERLDEGHMISEARYARELARDNEILATLPAVGEAEARALIAEGTKPKLDTLTTLRITGGVLFFNNGSGDRYPLFQFDQENRQVWPIVKAVNIMLGAGMQRRFALNWWVTAHPKLSGRAPMEFVGTGLPQLDPSILPLLIEIDIPTVAVHSTVSTSTHNSLISEMDKAGRKANIERANRAAELMAVFNSRMQEASQEGLSVKRMWEIVEEAYDKYSEETLAGQLLIAQLACKIVTRPDCPKDILWYVLTHPEPTTAFPKHSLVDAVLARVDLPEEFRAAAGLASLLPENKRIPENK